MSKFDDELKKLLDEDPLGLLDLTPKQSLIMTRDERLIASFNEINEFYIANKREPAKVTDINERKLYSRLQAIRKDPAKAELLREHDVNDLLKETLEALEGLNTAEDAVNNDPLGILSQDEIDIFDFKNIPKETKEMPNYRAKAKPCKDFQKFEHLFKQCHEDLRLGKRQLRPFMKEQQIEKGMFFVLKGVLVFVAEEGERVKVKSKTNARLRCIYDNGTESDLLLRSLSAQLYRDGRRVTELNEKLLDGFNDITNEDVGSGFIYVLKSKSEKPEIKNQKDLFKIGFTKLTTEQRIKNAKDDPTYLMADVEIIADFECYNMNAQKFEDLIHKFFSEVCLDTELLDGDGNLFKPREWFIVPYPVIEQAIHYLISGEIVDLKYDPKLREIVNR